MLRWGRSAGWSTQVGWRGGEEGEGGINEVLVSGLMTFYLNVIKQTIMNK